MSECYEIRDGDAADMPSIASVYRDAFPGEDLLPLVTALLSNRNAVDLLSLVALSRGAIAGHVAFTPCGIEGCGQTMALLAPLAVVPAARRKGLGRRLVREGLARLASKGVNRVLVLGDPAYYGRFGFVMEQHVLPPYPLVPEWRTAWQSLGVGASDPSCRGRLRLPEPWLRPQLWSP